MPYDKDGKYFRKPVFNENFKGLKNNKTSETTSNKPMTPDEIKKERFRKEYEKLKNYKGSESYQRMMSKNKGSASRNQSNKERLEYKKAAVDLAKSNNTGSAETPFDTSATDAFGVGIGFVFDMQEPVGSSTDDNTDLGSSETHVGA